MSSAFEGLPKTSNLKLNKPGYDNVADIEALNENADILDAEIQGIKNTFVKSVNGKEPDAGGNVNVEEYTHPNSGVTAGTYRSVTVNAQGHVTSGSNPTLAIADGGTGATTAKQARANLEVEPIGTIFAFAGNDIPTGYLPCNGSAISRTTYADLFAVIGTTYGAGDGSTTFNLPNLNNNSFLEGSDTAGTVKSAGLPKPSITVGIGTKSGKSGVSNDYGNTGKAFMTGGSNIASYLNYTQVTIGNSVYGNSTTVQPKSVTVKFCIKY